MKKWLNLVTKKINEFAESLSEVASSQNPTATPVRTGPREKRRFNRVVPQHVDLVTVTFSNGSKAFVSNISYGGFACATSPYFPDFSKSAEQEVTISIVARSHRCPMSHIHSLGGVSAFALHHHGPDTLLFLREMLEPMRQGSSLVRVPDEILKEKYLKGRWTYLRGEGPTDIMLRPGPDGTLVEALMTLHRDKAYQEVRYEHGVLSTGIAIDSNESSGYASSRMTSHQKSDPVILHHAACILLSTISGEASTLVDQLLRHVVAELGGTTGLISPPNPGSKRAV